MLLAPSLQLPRFTNTTPVPLHYVGTREVANIPGTLGWILPSSFPGVPQEQGLSLGCRQGNQGSPCPEYHHLPPAPKGY